MSDKHISDTDIIHYLTQNKDFFIRHPEQLEALKVNNNNGKVSSLINHQVNVLKQRNSQLKSKLNQLIGYAEENEKTMSQVFELTLQLCQISHIANVTKHFARFVKHSFDSDLFKIVVPAYDGLESSTVVKSLSTDEENVFAKVFEEYIHKGKPICGRLKKSKLQFIFGKQAEKIGSSVILPIGKNAEKGLLVFASFDESRFNPEMSTDLLARLSEILDRKFNKTFGSVNKTRNQENES
jgi:uncharacterized protein YigA (DUF484 family)